MAKMGRPTKYDPIAYDIAEEFYKQALQDRSIPFWQEMILNISDALDVGIDTIYDWANPEKGNANENFCHIMKKIRTLQGARLEKATMSRQLNATGAIFLLKARHGYIETQHTINENSNTINLVVQNPPKFKEAVRTFQLEDEHNKQARIGNEGAEQSASDDSSPAKAVKSIVDLI